MIISMIAAMDRNRLIGVNNSLPWHLPADFAHFKQTTMGKPILMGRKTFESIGRALPGRQNIVLTRNTELQFEGCVTAVSFEHAVELVADAEELMVIGGSSIYQALLDKANRLYITYVQAEFYGDAWFPEISEQEWCRVSTQVRPADENNIYDCEFVTYERC